MKTCFAVVLFLLSMFRPVQADSYVIGVENIHYLPYYASEGDSYIGFAREFLDMFADETGITYEYRPLPVRRLYLLFLRGRLDFKFPANSLWSRDLKQDTALIYSDPVVPFVDGLIVQPELLGKGVEAIRRIGMVNEFTPTGWTDRIADGRVLLVETSVLSNVIRLGLIGRVDGIYANPVVVDHLLRSNFYQPGALIFDPDLPHTRSHYHLATRKHQEVIRRFNIWMDQNVVNISRLKARYRLPLR